MKRMAMAAVMMVLLTGCSLADNEPDPEKYLTGSVNIGVSNGAPGWSLDNGSNWEGFDIELIKWLAVELKFTPLFNPQNAVQRMTVLREQKHGIKMVIANFSMTDGRREDIDFAGPYFEDVQDVLVHRDDVGITELGQLKGKRVCVTSGSTGEIKLDGIVAVIATPADTLRECVDLLLQRHVRGVLSDKSILESFAGESEGRVRVLGGDFGEERYGIGIPNDRPKLCRFLTDKLEIFVSQAWNQKFDETLGAYHISKSTRGGSRKPESTKLDSCEKPDSAQGMAELGAGWISSQSAVARQRRRRRVGSY